MANPSVLDFDVLARIDDMQLLAKTVVEGFILGLHRSPYRGFSVEFAEYRQYSPGDEVKHIDWKVFGKTDRYYIKQFEEETNLACYIILDASGSMGYGSRRKDGPNQAPLRRAAWRLPGLLHDAPARRHGADGV